MSRRAVGVAMAIALGILGLAACSSSSDSSSSDSTESSPAASESVIGGTATCDEASLRSALEAAMNESGSSAPILSIDGIECAEGWAVVFPTIGTSEEDAITVTEVLQAEGQFWVVKDRQEVCGTPVEGDPFAVPADAAVPAAIYQPACNTN